MLNEKVSKTLLWLGIAVFLIGISLFFWKESITTSARINPDKVGQFGDFVGGVVGAVWSLAGVILFYIALQEQRKDISINKEALQAQITALNQQIREFELQRTELEETRKVFFEQSETLKIQRFENTFFQLVNLYHEIVDKLSYKSEEKRGVFKLGILDFLERIKKQNMPYNFEKHEHEKKLPINRIDAERRMVNAYEQFHFQDSNQLFSHYFRSLYHIFKFIAETDLIKEDAKQFYATIIRGQLSSDELFLLLYNSMVEGLGYPKFLSLAKRFDVFQNFDFDLINDMLYHMEIYEQRLNSIN